MARKHNERRVVLLDNRRPVERLTDAELHPSNDRRVDVIAVFVEVHGSLARAPGYTRRRVESQPRARQAPGLHRAEIHKLDGVGLRGVPVDPFVVCVKLLHRPVDALGVRIERHFECVALTDVAHIRVAK